MNPIIMDSLQNVNSTVTAYFFRHTVLENQIQGLSRTLPLFKHFFQGLENLEEKIKDFQGLSRTGKSQSLDNKGQ